jgi:hypothetical protein
MKYLIKIKDENGQVIDTKEYTSIKQIAEALDCTTSAVTKNFKCQYDPNEKPSKKISQKIFDSKYNIKYKSH